jgi:hypothetical protein
LYKKGMVNMKFKPQTPIPTSLSIS